MHSVDFLSSIVLLLLTAVVVVALFRYVKMSPVLGYFVAGAMIGEHGFKFVTTENTSAFAEFGIVFLLFAIGLELTFERLLAMRKYVFGFGTLQVLITGVILALIVRLLGYSGSAATIIGGGLALSSTAIVLQVVAENRQQSTQVGRLSLATLLLQDFAVVPLLVLMPLLAGDHTTMMQAMGVAVVKALLALVGIFVAGRLLLRPLFALIGSANSARTNELFVATTLLIALSAAWGTEQLGLSLALGAFVAGLLVAETEFQHQVEETITPFKGLFLGLFFMTVGMSINIKLIIDALPLILLLSFGLLAIKAVIITTLCILFRFSLGASIHAGLLLAQGGEFAFILFGLASGNGLIGKELGQTLMLVVTVTMALTPLLSYLGNMIVHRFEKDERLTGYQMLKETADLDNHVVIAGFGRVGKMVARLLEAEHVHYVAVDINAQNVKKGRAEGFPVYHGDSAAIEMLKTLGIERAQSAIITIENEVALKNTARIINKHYPALPVIVRAKDLSKTEELKNAGATIIVPETYETGLQLGGAVLKSVGVSEFEVSRIKNLFRAGNYVLAKEKLALVEQEMEEVGGARG
jgi:monovalent cation:H+ antiporter-2, CPA2 family